LLKGASDFSFPKGPDNLLSLSSLLFDGYRCSVPGGL